MSSSFSQYADRVEKEASPEKRALLDITSVHFEDERSRLTSVPAALTIARARLGLTQQQLAEAAGMQQSEVSRIESGRANPTLQTLITLASSLGMRISLVDQEQASLTGNRTPTGSNTTP